MIDIGADLQRAYDEGYAKGMQDARKAGEWIPVTERLPEVGFDVLTWENSVMNVSFLFGNGRWFNAVQPSHWMPLPEPPKGEKE